MPATLLTTLPTARRRLWLSYALLVLVLVLGCNLLLAWAFHRIAPFASGYPRFFFATNTFLALLYFVGSCVLEASRLGAGGRDFAQRIGAREALPGGPLDAERREAGLVALVAEQARALRMPPPSAWVLATDPSVRAYAAGWRARDAALVVSQGALQLPPDELRHVVHQELAHVRSGRAAFDLQCLVLVWGLRLPFDLGRQLTERGPRERKGVQHLAGGLLVTIGLLGLGAAWLLERLAGRPRHALSRRLLRSYDLEIEARAAAPAPVVPVARVPAAAAAPMLRHDATQNPAWAAAEARSREALEHIAFWHGPVQLELGLLALVMAPQDDADWQAWSALAGASSTAGDVRTAVQALLPAQRLPVLALLAARLGSALVDARPSLRRALRRLPPTPARRLRRLALGALLRSRPVRVAAASSPQAAGAATWYLAQCLPAAVAPGWLESALALLDEPAPARASLRDALRLRHLPPLQRPRLVRAWSQAALPWMADETVVDTLLLACWLLDSPPPESIARRRRPVA